VRTKSKALLVGSLVLVLLVVGAAFAYPAIAYTPSSGEQIKGFQLTLRGFAVPMGEENATKAPLLATMRLEIVKAFHNKTHGNLTIIRGVVVRIVEGNALYNDSKAFRIVHGFGVVARTDNGTYIALKGIAFNGRGYVLFKLRGKVLGIGQGAAIVGFRGIAITEGEAKYGLGLKGYAVPIRG